MSYNHQSQSAQALSDPMPRIYSCFCAKIFTTYPGVYLHLKSKHTNLFDKYKKLKITRLFKKINDQQGNPIYQLERLPQTDSTKIKEDRSFIKQPKQVKKEEQVAQEQDYIFKQKKNTKANHLARRKMATNAGGHQFQGDNFDYQMERRRFIANSFANMPMGMSLPPFNPMFHSYPPVFPQLRLTTKKVMQKFLQQLQTNLKLQAKTYLYSLMIFIDTNYQLIKDERAKHRIFLSYCSDFDPQLIAPIVVSYLQLLQARRNNLIESNQESSLDTQTLCIKGFTQFLRTTGLAHFQMIEESVKRKKNSEEEKTQKMPVLIEWQEQSEQYGQQISQNLDDEKE